MSTVHGRRTDARLLTAWDEEPSATALPPAERLGLYPIAGQVPATPGIERTQAAVLMRHLVQHRGILSSSVWPTGFRRRTDTTVRAPCRG